MQKVANEVVSVEDIEKFVSLLTENIEICQTRHNTYTELSDKAYRMGLIVGYTNAKTQLQTLIATKKYIEG